MGVPFSAVTYALAQKYTKDSLEGKGALKGEKGDPGKDGEQGPKGEKGDPGKDAKVTVGNVSSGETPSVTPREENGTQYLDFVLPKGDKGDKGDPGEKGADGDPGEQGPTGATGVQGPKGDPGEKGDPGKDGQNGKDGKTFSVSAQYTTEEALIQAHPTGIEGEAYYVGTESPYDVYVWLEDQQKWFNQGPFKGEKGDKGDPGDPGQNGADGTQGPEGPRGPQGIQGLPGQDGKDGKDGQDGYSPYLTFDATSRTDGTIVTLHNKDGEQSFIVKNGKDGSGTATGSDGETYTFTQDANDPNTIILTDSKGNRQSVTVKGKEYKFESDKDNPMKVHLIDKKDPTDDQTVEIPIHTTAVEGYPTPVGTVISFMGKTPPSDYLICDGKTYNIADYPELSNFFNAQFGANNYFGGDGTTTFAVPNLNGEFLRGAGTNAHENQGSGEEVGEHQDGTEINTIYGSTTYASIYFTNTGNVKNYDSDLSKSNDAGRYSNEMNVGTVGSEAYKPSRYTTRPTNTSVLYCIKYKSDTVLNNVYSTEETVVGRWIDGKPIYRKITEFSKRDINTGSILSEVNITGIDQYVTSTLYRDNTSEYGSAEFACGVDAYQGNFHVYPVTKCADITAIILEYTKTTDDTNTIPAGSNPSTYTEYSTVATDEEVEEALK